MMIWPSEWTTYSILVIKSLSLIGAPVISRCFTMKELRLPSLVKPRLCFLRMLSKFIIWLLKPSTLRWIIGYSQVKTRFIGLPYAIVGSKLGLIFKSDTTLHGTFPWMSQLSKIFLMTVHTLLSLQLSRMIWNSRMNWERRWTVLWSNTKLLTPITQVKESD